MTINRKADVKRLTPLAVILTVLIFPTTAHAKPKPIAHAAWDVAAEGHADCNFIDGTLKTVNPASADFAIVVERTIGTNPPFAERILDHYSPGDMSFHLLSGIPQNGTTATIKVWLVDHDSLNRVTPRPRDVTTVGVFPVGPCGSPPVSPPPFGPPVTPPAPPALAKVCVPSGTVVELHKTGPRSFALTGKAKRIRWRLGGNLVQKGGRTISIPGDSTGRLVVKFRANCQPGKLVGEVVPSTPPETAG